VLNPFIHWIEAKGPWAPWLFLALFVAASFLMIWRLEVMSGRGFDGTVLGTLVMPYCSGMGNLIFAFILGHRGGNGGDVMINSLVNNVTNMTLVLGLPAIFWRMSVSPQKKKPSKAAGKAHELNRLSVLLTLAAVLFFTPARSGRWAARARLVSMKGSFWSGLFLFWQFIHVIEVLKSNVRQGKSLSWTLPFDLALLGVGAYGIYVSTDWLVEWTNHIHGGFIKGHIGWLSGWLMVLPNGVLAFYYGWRGQPRNRLCLANR